MLNKLADDFIETVKTELNWLRQNPKLLHLSHETTP